MDLDDRMKMYEGLEAQRLLMPRLPVVARMDGICFHSFTSGLDRPYSEAMSRSMIDTTRMLVEHFGADCGYTQSDEISLGWSFENISTDPQMYAGGRVLKLATHLASKTTLFFARSAQINFGEDWRALVKKYNGFDSRVWNVPNLVEASNAILWREQDATKNSIQMAARSVYSHKECHNKNGSQLQEMLFEKGINWNDYPAFFKRGTYILKRKKSTPFTAEEIETLPPLHAARKNPDLVVERVSFEELTPQLGNMNIDERVDFLFGKNDYHG